MSRTVEAPRAFPALSGSRHRRRVAADNAQHDHIIDVVRVPVPGTSSRAAQGGLDGGVAGASTGLAEVF